MKRVKKQWAIVPFGKASVRRGQRYANDKTAECFLNAYAVGVELDSAALKKWAQLREELTIKTRRSVNRIVSVLRKVGTSRYTPAPFWIRNTGPNRWRVEAAKQAINSTEIAAALQSLAKSQEMTLRHLVQSIKPEEYSAMERVLMELVWDLNEHCLNVVLSDIKIWRESFQKQIKRLQGGDEERRQLG